MYLPLATSTRALVRLLSSRSHHQQSHSNLAQSCFRASRSRRDIHWSLRLSRRCSVRYSRQRSIARRVLRGSGVCKVWCVRAFALHQGRLPIPVQVFAGARHVLRIAVWYRNCVSLAPYHSQRACALLFRALSWVLDAPSRAPQRHRSWTLPVSRVRARQQLLAAPCGCFRQFVISTSRTRDRPCLCCAGLACVGAAGLATIFSVFSEVLMIDCWLFL